MWHGLRKLNWLLCCKNIRLITIFTIFEGGCPGIWELNDSSWADTDVIKTKLRRTLSDELFSAFAKTVKH